MSSLLAILLVVNSTRGHHYVLSYPADPQRPLANRDQEVRSGFSVASSNAKTNMQREESLEEGKQEMDVNAYAGRDSIFNIDVSFLADTLAPKLPLCDRKFQLSMDDLVFVGHPVSLTTTVETNHNDDGNNTIISSPTLPPSSSTATATTITSPSLPVSRRRPSTAMAGVDNDDDDDKHLTTSSHMTLFHVVFVMSPPDLELNQQVDAIYTHVAVRYAAALRYEQLRCGYVQEEIEKVLALKEDAFNKGTPYGQVMHEILRESSLARDIKQIYKAISMNTAAHIIINDFIDLSLQIPTFGVNASAAESMADASTYAIGRTRDYYYASLMDIYGMGGYEYDDYPVLCPYHTLLLLEDPEEVLKNMPLDASPTLVQLVQILTPTQSLQELHLLLDCSLAQMYRLAAHLIYWRKAKLIHTIHARNRYVVSPQAKLNDLSSLDADFKMHIPNLDLPTLLSQLSIAKPLHMVAPSKELRNQYLEAITYLLRKDLVIQLHMFLVLILPPGIRSAGIGNFDEAQEDQLDEGRLASSPSNVGEWKSLKRMVHEKAPKELAELFERLIPYMDGKHHIEEIMYREGVSRKQLGLVLKFYKDNVATVYHY
ncbi:Nitrogen permease regulator 3 [Apophysomyces sp. BC1034]|nr:Nitrogen permease regulator 3 [Apophysomyces sp. BC1015]KAG0180020.1 Nitrogen permease regulator 3 [Apophysomyces sp. BC1021]KAG0190548.1 Nitrogen permease regulator 3 [Apophysomyces sp. BC1034]